MDNCIVPLIVVIFLTYLNYNGFVSGIVIVHQKTKIKLTNQLKTYYYF